MEGDEPLYNFHAHPDHALILGQMTATWAIIEYRISHVFTWMIGCSPLHGAAAYYALQSMQARTGMMRALMQYLHSDDERAEIDIILSRLGEIATVRNTYMHTPWMRRGKDTYLMRQIGQRFPHGFKKPVSIVELTAEAMKLVEFSLFLEGELVRLTRGRPLYLNRVTVPPALLEKFPQLFGVENGEVDLLVPTHQDDEPPPQS
jgi:hypothetical protein